MKKFEDELGALHDRLSEMAVLAKSMVQLVTSGVKDTTKDIMAELASCEKQLDAMQVEVDQKAVQLLTVYGPVATSLRDLLVVTHVTAQLERMGDQCVNVCESVQMMSAGSGSNKMLPAVSQLATLVCEIVDDALDAYFRKDPEKAKDTRARDDLADALTDQVMKEIFTDEVLRNVLAGSTDIADAVSQVLIARHLERIADQATNICKEIVYLVEGEDVRHNAGADGPASDEAED